MLDVSPLDALRIVGGLRVERWLLNVSTPGLLDESRDVTDFLGSANLTWRLNDEMNLRLAGYQTVSRPDPREVSLTVFAPVTGECTNRGNPELTRSTILNSDLRWEWFPGPGELVSASAFYKRFDDPFIQVVTIQSLRCSITPENAESAVNFGGEVEFRKNLDFFGFGDFFERLTAGVNYTFTEGDITPRPENAVGAELLPLQDQSRHLVNGSLTWASEGGGFQAAALVNHFSDRVRRYGKVSQDTETGDFVRTPDVVERGRTTFDAKVSSRLGPFSLSLAARNLTDERIEQVQTLFDGSFVPTNLEAIGREFQLSLTYRIR
jgi:outer membrane receptor protein involved in Fe transport